MKINCAPFSLLVFYMFSASGATAQVPVGRFVDVKPIASLEAGSYWDCCHPVSPDGLLLVFASDRGPSIDMYQVTRASTDEPFGSPTLLGSRLNTAYGDASSGISNDGLTLFFNSNRPGGEGRHDLYMATRESLTDPFGDVTHLGLDVNTPFDDGAAVPSSDGLTLYFNSYSSGSGDADLFKTTRTSLDEPFGAGTLLENVNTESFDGSPSISADELHLFFNSGRAGTSQLYVASRNSRDESFGQPVNLNDFSLGSHINVEGVDEIGAYISTDWPAYGSKLYFTRIVNPNSSDIFAIPDWDIHEATWIPEPSTTVPSCLGLMSLLAWRRRRRPLSNPTAQVSIN